MKEKYADQDDEEREMKLALLGSTQKVKGFDIDAHSKFKQGSMYIDPNAVVVNQRGASDDEEDEDEDADENQEEID